LFVDGGADSAGAGGMSELCVLWMRSRTNLEREEEAGHCRCLFLSKYS